MAEKKSIQNKAEKKTTAKKAPVKKSIDWDSLGDSVTIIGKGGKHLSKGKEYIVTKETGKLLVNKGVADLK
jgi:hypothetical protein